MIQYSADEVVALDADAYRVLRVRGA